MTVARTLLKFMGLGLLVGLDLLRPQPRRIPHARRGGDAVGDKPRRAEPKRRHPGRSEAESRDPGATAGEPPRSRRCSPQDGLPAGMTELFNAVQLSAVPRWRPARR